MKNFTTAEGGASTWKEIEGVENKEIYKFYQLLSLHGQSKDAYYENLITLPLHTLLTDDDVEYVCSAIRKTLHEVKISNVQGVL